jgi:hypothetical protein
MLECGVRTNVLEEYSASVTVVSTVEVVSVSTHII